MIEKWLPVKDYEGLYEVSNLGRVKSLERKAKNKCGLRTIRGRILKSSISDTGYHKVALCKNMNQKTYFVHRLVAETFLGIKGKGLKGKELLVNHKDQNKLNNILDNLEWVSQIENMRQAKNNIANVNLFHSKKVQCSGKINLVFNSIKEASDYFKVKYHIIVNCLVGNTKTACGLNWNYMQELEQKHNIGSEE